MAVDKSNAFIAALFAVCALAGAGFQWWTEPGLDLIVVGDSHVRVQNVNRKEPLTVKFTLRNQSQSPIVIDSLQSGCSCVTSEVDGTVIPAKGSTIVSVTVRTFDAYAQDFMQQARVSWSGTPLILTISGTLSPSDKVLYRPVRLVLKEEPLRNRLADSLVIRIPKHCSGERTMAAEGVLVSGIPESQVDVEPLESSEHYREYRIVVSSPQLAIDRQHHGDLKISTPCESITIPISLADATERK